MQRLLLGDDPPHPRSTSRQAFTPNHACSSAFPAGGRPPLQPRTPVQGTSLNGAYPSESEPW
eukprot:scaffold93858_cov40-Tisochrysis_lutea.AAC.1